ncbi:transcriptional regulator, IclR family [Rhodococcus erythropolis]|uniref:IclR family transcriptional regulator n=1 Tax=Rhodococcus erythropolis TaxID=1833 RepID=UPI0008763B3B|nr:IclR family transcriptional regulator C-terminal domain-containing protein [Rhodococcus erythropolis]MBT1256355.1 helix-turn-helix domain-containing protein [Rhodococcus erythropolis]OHF25110.1 IclR family transcriptional regulator [Rhodococcus erythropolis]SCY94244.1 transcriptional regulator, IclR family [Rhodococcus erythropolis]
MVGRPRDLGGHEPRAVQRALALLESAARLGSGATAKDIAALADIPPATAYRLLNILVADGYLVRIADLSGFALGRRTRELAGAAAEPTPVDNSVLLEELREQLRFGVYLASFAENRIRLVDRDPDHELSGERTLVTAVHASAIGKLLLASRPELAEAPLRKVTAHTITDGDQLELELSRIRRGEPACEVDEIRVGRSAVAVPIHDAERCVVGALAAIGPTGRLSVDDVDLVALLREYAERIVAPTMSKAS